MSQVNVSKPEGKKKIKTIYGCTISFPAIDNGFGGATQTQEDYVDTGLSGGAYYILSASGFSDISFQSINVPLFNSWAGLVGYQVTARTKTVNNQLRVYAKVICYAAGQRAIDVKIYVLEIKAK